MCCGVILLGHKILREAKHRAILFDDLESVGTPAEKYTLTHGGFSLIENDLSLKAEVVAYAYSASGDVLVFEGLPSESAIYECPNLYREMCHRSYLVPIHQQFVESYFS